MKRPLVLAGFCYLLTQAAAVFFGAGVSRVLFFVCLGGFAVTFVYWRTRRAAVFPAAFLIAAAALGSFCLYTRMAVQPPRMLDGRDETVEATVCELPVSQYGRWYYVMQVDGVDDKTAPQHFKIRLSSQRALDVEPYSRFRGKIHLFLPQGGDGYSSRGYYESKGISMFAYLDEYGGIRILPAVSHPPYFYALRLRRALIDSVGGVLPAEEASLVNGILLGDVSGLDGSLTADFRTDGISHILSVSGLHMATIAELLLFLLLFLRVRKRAASVLTAAGVLAFMAVTCFVPSVTRSGLMCLLVLSGPVVSRRADPLNSLCAAALLICLANPYAAADVGFLLSFTATLGLIQLSGPIAGFLNRRFDKVPLLRPLVQGVNGVLATSAAATLFTLPIILLNFGTVSLVSPLANLLELAPSTLLIGFGAGAAVLNLLFPQSYLAMPFALAAGLLAKYMRWCAAWLARIPLASISASQGFVPLWLGGTVLLFAAAYGLARGKKLFPRTACLSVIVLLAGILSYQLSERGVTRIAVLDTGTSLSVVMTRGNHAAVVGCDTYNSGKIVSWLNHENAASLDFLELLTQNHGELTAAADVSGRFAPRRLVAQQAAGADGFVQKALESSAGNALFHSAARASFWDGVTAETVWTGNAACARITAQGVTVLLCPSEADPSTLPENWRRCDFLVTDGAPSGEKAPDAVFTVFAMDQSDLAKDRRIVSATRAVWTGGCGNVVLQISGDRTLSIRREE